MPARVQLRGSFVTDHRGNRLPLERPVNKLDVRSEISGETGRRIHAAMMRGYFGSRWWRAAVLLATIFTIVVIFLAINQHVISTMGPQQWVTSWVRWIMPLLFGGTIGLTVWGDFALERLYARRRLANALLEENHCPRCLYSLNGLPEEDDGCTVCPECGAAWQI